jgi:hypothetical protein
VAPVGVLRDGDGHGIGMQRNLARVAVAAPVAVPPRWAYLRMHGIGWQKTLARSAPGRTQTSHG